MPFRHVGGCPHCGGSFLRRQTKSYSYKRCKKCLGVWIEWNVLEKLMRDIAPGVGWELSGGHDDRKRPCPKCNSKMLRSNILQVPIDYCSKDRHGAWLDKDELKQILERVAEPSREAPAAATSFTSLLNDFFN
jgi:Zn-finger nucleic acid-binding protein